MKTSSAAAFLLVSCYPNPTTPTPVDDPAIVVPVGDAAATPEQRACALLSQLKCKEGDSPKCEEAFRTAPISHVEAFNADCVLAARTQAAARACGVRCL